MAKNIGDKTISEAFGDIVKSATEMFNGWVLKLDEKMNEDLYKQPKEMSRIDRFWLTVTEDIENNPQDWFVDTHTLDHKKSDMEIWIANRGYSDLKMWRGPVAASGRCPGWLHKRLRNAIDAVGVNEGMSYLNTKELTDSTST